MTISNEKPSDMHTGPHKPLIYERADGITYAREFGDDPSTRTPIKWDSLDQVHINSVLDDASLWLDIRRAAETNKTLHDALEHVKILYHLSKKDDGKE